MLLDRYDPVDMFTQLPGLCLRADPVLRELDRLLEDEVKMRYCSPRSSKTWPGGIATP
jgi:hypothetical protein